MRLHRIVSTIQNELTHSSRAHMLEESLSSAVTCSARFQHAWSFGVWPEALHRGWSECCGIAMLWHCKNRTRQVVTGSGTHSLRGARLRPMVEHELSVLKRRGMLSFVERRPGVYAASFRRL